MSSPLFGPPSAALTLIHYKHAQPGKSALTSYSLLSSIVPIHSLHVCPTTCWWQGFVHKGLQPCIPPQARKTSAHFCWANGSKTASQIQTVSVSLGLSRLQYAESSKRRVMTGFDIVDSFATMVSENTAGEAVVTMMQEVDPRNWLPDIFNGEAQFSACKLSISLPLP